MNHGDLSVNLAINGNYKEDAQLKNHVYQLVQAAQNWNKSKDACKGAVARRDTGLRNALPGRPKINIPKVSGNLS